MAKRLDSAVAVRNVRTEGRHSAGETLYLMVWPSARKTWVQRLTIEGKRKDLGLGPYPTVSLAEARKKAQDNLSLVNAGGNPLAAKQEESALASIPTLRPWPGSTSPRTSAPGGAPSTGRSGAQPLRPMPSRRSAP